MSKSLDANITDDGLIEELIDSLKKDIEYHKAGELLEIGNDTDTFEKFKPKNIEHYYKILEFWYSWSDESTHGFVSFYPPIKEDDWPEIAESIVGFLENKSELHPLFFHEVFEYRPYESGALMGFAKLLLVVLAFVIHLSGLMSPLTPSEGYPTLMELLICWIFPVVLVWLTSFSMKQKVLRIFSYISMALLFFPYLILLLMIVF